MPLHGALQVTPQVPLLWQPVPPQVPLHGTLQVTPQVPLQVPPQVPLHGTLHGTLHRTLHGPLQGPPPEGLRWKCSKLCCGREKKATINTSFLEESRNEFHGNLCL